MIRITVPTATDRELQRFAALGKSLPTAEKRARASAVRKMRTEGQRVIRETRRLKVGAAKDRIKPITFGGVPGGVEVDGSPIPIVAFRHRQTKSGVTFYSHTSGPHRVDGGFIASMKGGHVGVFKRVGKERLPIKERYTTGVASSFKDEASIERVTNVGSAEWYATMERLLKAKVSNI